MRFYFEQLNLAWTRPQAGLLTPLCLPTAQACNELEAVAVKLVSDEHRYTGPPITVQSVVALRSGPEEHFVDVQGRQEKRDVVDRQGVVVSTDAREESHFQVGLAWTPRGWQISSMVFVR